VSSDLFRNDAGLLDGNTYGIVLNREGVAVLAFDQAVPEGETGVSGANLINVEIKGIHVSVVEIPAISQGPAVDNDPESPSIVNNFHQTGPVGEVVRIGNIVDTAGAYMGNALSDAHFLLAKAKQQGFSNSRGWGTLSITDGLLAWADREDGLPVTLEDLFDMGQHLILNGDGEQC
jgi:hypothetical protein